MGYLDDDDDETIRGAAQSADSIGNQPITRGAAQSADSIGKQPLVGLVVGILHITIPAKGRAQPISKRR